MKHTIREVAKFLGLLLIVEVVLVALAAAVQLLANSYGWTTALIVEWSIVGLLVLLAIGKIVRDGMRQSRREDTITHLINASTALRDEYMALHDKRHSIVMARVSSAPFTALDGTVYQPDAEFSLDDEARMLTLEAAQRAATIAITNAIDA